MATKATNLRARLARNTKSNTGSVTGLLSTRILCGGVRQVRVRLTSGRIITKMLSRSVNAVYGS